MKKSEYFEFAKAFFGQCIEIAEKKNADYTGKTPDPFANFSSVEVLGISTEQGFLTRMMDKIKRVSSFVENGSLQVKDESVKDTLQDLANYCCLFAGYLHSKKEQVEEVKKPDPGFALCVEWAGPSFKKGDQYKILNTDKEGKYILLNEAGFPHTVRHSMNCFVFNPDKPESKKPDPGFALCVNSIGDFFIKGSTYKIAGKNSIGAFVLISEQGKEYTVFQTDNFIFNPDKPESKKPDPGFALCTKTLVNVLKQEMFTEGKNYKILELRPDIKQACLSNNEGVGHYVDASEAHGEWFQYFIFNPDKPENK